MRKFYCLNTCTTCRRVKKWFLDHDLDLGQEIDIRNQAPTLDELRIAYDHVDGQVRKLMNTSGGLYREMDLKNKLDDMAVEEVLELLSENGMLVKRPFIIDGQRVTVGGKEELLEANWK